MVVWSSHFEQIAGILFQRTVNDFCSRYCTSSRYMHSCYIVKLFSLECICFHEQINQKTNIVCEITCRWCTHWGVLRMHLSCSFCQNCRSIKQCRSGWLWRREPGDSLDWCSGEAKCPPAGETDNAFRDGNACWNVTIMPEDATGRRFLKATYVQASVKSTSASWDLHNDVIGVHLLTWISHSRTFSSASLRAGMGCCSGTGSGKRGHLISDLALSPSPSSGRENGNWEQVGEDNDYREHVGTLHKNLSHMLRQSQDIDSFTVVLA